MKPVRDLKREGSVVFFMNGVTVRLLQGATDGASQARRVIDEEDFFAQLHQRCFWPSIGCASESKQAGNGVDGEGEDDGVKGK